MPDSLSYGIEYESNADNKQSCTHCQDTNILYSDEIDMQQS